MEFRKISNLGKFMIHFYIALCFALLSFVSTPLSSFEVQGRVDVSGAIVDVDVLESGKTIETLHMKGVKADAIISFYKGMCIKPGIIFVGNDGEFTILSIGAGQYIPITKKITILPTVGVSWSFLHTTIDIPEILLFDAKERFHSISPFVSLEVSWQFAEKWYLHGLAQYAWSRTKTTIVHLLSQKSHSDGPNYGLGLEYSFNKSWSLTLGAGYNISLSHEKHGLRAKGLKLGVIRYF
jgi:hypothetical protein